MEQGKMEQKKELIPTLRYVKFLVLTIVFDLALYFALGAMIIFVLIYKFGEHSLLNTFLVIISLILVWLVRVNDRLVTIKMKDYVDEVH